MLTVKEPCAWCCLSSVAFLKDFEAEQGKVYQGIRYAIKFHHVIPLQQTRSMSTPHRTTHKNHTVKSRAEACVSIQDIRNFKVLITNMPHFFYEQNFFVCQENWNFLRFHKIKIIKMLKISAFYHDEQKSCVPKKSEASFRTCY